MHAVWVYFLDRVLPGLFTMSIWSVTMWRLHRAQKRHERDLAEIKARLDTK